MSLSYSLKKTNTLIILSLTCFFISTQLFAKNLFVSTSGDDSTDYDHNSIDTPWKTLNHAIFNLKAGDILNIRGGYYKPSYVLRLRSDYDNKTYGGNPDEKMNSETGTSEKPVIIKNYDDEKVIIDLIDTKTFVRLSDKDYWTFDGLEFINTGSAFVLGNNGTAYYTTLRNLIIRASYGGDNSANIKIDTELADYSSIENNLLEGPGLSTEIHLNTAGIYARKVKNLKILNNTIYNAPIGIYFKHRPVDNLDPIDMEIAFNYIIQTSRSAMLLETVNAYIHDNIIGENNGAVEFNTAAGAPGGDYNTIEHNTFVTTLNLRWDTQSDDPTPGAIGNIVKNNIFIKQLMLHWYSSNPHETKLDFNLYNTGYATGENRTNYYLPDWQLHSVQDASSQSGEIKFSGGNSLKFPSDYSLTDESTGKGMTASGRDPGANVSSVGYRSTSQPKAPVLNVQ